MADNAKITYNEIELLHSMNGKKIFVKGFT